jgi:hypothetical protein
MDGFIACRSVFSIKINELRQQAEKHAVSNAIIFLCESFRVIQKNNILSWCFHHGPECKNILLAGKYKSMNSMRREYG